MPPRNAKLSPGAISSISNFLRPKDILSKVHQALVSVDKLYCVSGIFVSILDFYILVYTGCEAIRIVLDIFVEARELGV